MLTTTDSRHDLRSYVHVVRARKWEIALITILVVVGGVFVTLRQRPVYEGRSKVLVRPVQSFGPSSYALTQAPNLDTERQLIMSQAIAGQVHGATSPRIATATLLHHVTVQVVGDTEVLQIAYRSTSRATAAAVADGFANAYVRFRTAQTRRQFDTAAAATEARINQVQSDIEHLESKLSGARDQGQRDALAAQRDTFVAQMGVLQSRLTDLLSTASTVPQAAMVIQRSDVPTAPVSPQKVRDVAVALVGGLFLGVGFAFLRERLDDRVKDREELEDRLGAPVLAVVPRIAGWRRRDECRLVMRTDPKGPASEAYRTLATNLQFLASRNDARVLLVTGSTGGEGKSVTSANLAVALAQSGRNVVLVSADLRKPRAARFFNLPNVPGLSEVLSGAVPDAVPILMDPGIANLRVLGSGATPRNPAELLAGSRCASVIEDLRQIADLVILDAPPVLAVADASILAGLGDGVIFLVDSERTKRSAIVQSRAQLATAGAQILGIVHNNFDPGQGHAYPYHAYASQRYYGHAASNPGSRTSGGGGVGGRLAALRGRHAPVMAGFGNEDSEPVP
jgi:capsular exopolysaccharide synthesis family protein